MDPGRSTGVVPIRQLALLLPILLAAAAGAAEVGPRDVSPNNPEAVSGAVLSMPGAAGRELEPARFPEEFRTIAGRHNNGRYRSWGAANQPLRRLLEPGYGDGVALPAGGTRPGARAISNACVAQERLVASADNASGFLWQWGQFLDHDLSLVPVSIFPERFDIEVPAGDPSFDPDATGTATIPLTRSAWASVDGVRQQINSITAWIDASNIYGSDSRRARAMRGKAGTLRMSEGDLPPFNEGGLPNSPSNDPSFFLGGDFRANEQVALTAMHALFIREHNQWVAAFREADPDLPARFAYQMARAIVGAEMQAITYREFLPLLLGPDALEPYAGYDREADSRIANEFTTAAFRVGHTMLPPSLLLLDRRLKPVGPGEVPLRGAFFRPDLLVEHGLEPFLRGLAWSHAQEVDPRVVDEVRNFLFGEPGSGGFDLPALNIQRGRDHGLPSLNGTRRGLGLAPYADFDDVPAGPQARAALAEVYPTIEDVDLWVGGLVERHVQGAMVGETFFTLIKDQFERLRDGDRFWYESYLPPQWVRRVERRNLARILRANTEIGREISDDVFRVGG
jgi:hypothetical protein